MKVIILMADRCSSTSVAASMEFLETANVIHQYLLKSQTVNTKDAAPLFELETASMTGKSITSTGGLILTPQSSVTDITPSGTHLETNLSTDLETHLGTDLETRLAAHIPRLIIVPGFMFNILNELPKLEPMCNWLKEQHDKGDYIANICTGAFVSAQAGLLEHKRATTHWLFSEQFQRAFPNTKLQTERTVTDDGLVLCSGGSTSSADLLIHLIRKFGSPQLAAECAKKLLVSSGDRSQAPYSSTTFKKQHQDPDILKIQIWMEKRLHTSISMEALVTEFDLSMRNFIRRFKEATDQTPIQYLQNLRLEKAKHLLESSQEAFEQITYRVGLQDANTFRKLFKQRVGLTPGAYRKQFGWGKAQ